MPPSCEKGYRYGARVPLFLDTGAWRQWIWFRWDLACRSVGAGKRWTLLHRFRYVSVPPVERAKEHA
jgi:hypothetical protein